jgi:class 3 adenylate cyclase
MADNKTPGPAPILAGKDHGEPSVFQPENLLREARRQKRLASGYRGHPIAFTHQPAREQITVKLLGALFSQFDVLAIHHGLETIKTIGDGYMVTSGILKEPSPECTAAVAEMALSTLDATHDAGRGIDVKLQLRIGTHTGGPVVAGVLGTHKIAFDVWGDAVNTAKRMESYGLPGRIHISAAMRQALGDAFRFEPRGPLDVKGKGPMETYFLYRCN